MNVRNFLKNFREIRKMTRVGKPSHPVIQVCPICFINSLSQQSTFLKFLIPTSYVCTNCGYTGPIYAEVDIKEYPKILEEMEKESGVILSDREEVNDDS